MSLFSKLGGFARRIVPARFRPIGYLVYLTRKRSRDRVVSGPFAGMEYVWRAFGSAYIPKLLGIYERELAWCVEAACAARPDRIVNLGAAEGYYAVGLARRNPQARVVAFEMMEFGRNLLSEMVALNGVSDRVEVRGAARCADLSAALDGALRPLVACDVEGEETTLLDSDAVPGLRGAWILVEVHDDLKPGIGKELEARFADTHRVTLIPEESRSRSEFPYRTLLTRLLSRSYLEWTVSEWRPARMSWLWMEPLSRMPRERETVNW